MNDLRCHRPALASARIWLQAAKGSHVMHSLLHTFFELCNIARTMIALAIAEWWSEIGSVVVVVLLFHHTLSWSTVMNA